MNDNIQSQIQNNKETIRLGEIAEVKKISLHDVRAADLIISSSLGYHSGENKDLLTDKDSHSWPVMTIFERLKYIMPQLVEFSNNIDYQNIDYSRPIDSNLEFKINGYKSISFKHLLDLQDIKKSGYTPLSRWTEPEEIFIFQSKIYVLRLTQKGLEAFSPEFIQMELIEKTPQKLVGNFKDKDFKELLSIEISKTEIKDQIGHLEKDKRSLILRDQNTIRHFNDALDVLKAPTIKLSDFIDQLSIVNSSTQCGLFSLKKKLTNSHKIIPFILLDPTEYDQLFEKKCGYPLEEASNQIRKKFESEKLEIQGKAVDELLEFKEFLIKEVESERMAFVDNINRNVSCIGLISPKSIFEILTIIHLRRAYPTVSQIFRKLLETQSKLIKSEKASIIAGERAEEKERIMAILAHSIHGLLLSSVLRPMQKMKRKKIDDGMGCIDDALEGLEVLREVVEAVKLSKSGTNADFLADLKNHGETAISIGDIINRAFYATITNMLTDKFSGNCGLEYFPTTDVLHEADENLGNVDRGNKEALISFTKEYFQMDITLDCPKSVKNLLIGNEFKSASRLTVLFQELFQNAFKNAAYVEPFKRSISLILQQNDDELNVTMCNRYNASRERPDTRIGMEIIDGFLRHIGSTDFQTSDKENLYTVSFTLNLPRKVERNSRN